MNFYRTVSVRLRAVYSKFPRLRSRLPVSYTESIIRQSASVVNSSQLEGVQVDDGVEDYSYGRFGWLTDPERNRIELREPRDPALEAA